MPTAAATISGLRANRAVIRAMFSDVARKTSEPTESRMPTVASLTP